MIMGFVKTYTDAWQAAFSPCWLLYIDENMIQWKGIGSAHLTFIKRKPTPLGMLWRTLTCGITGILLAMEPQDALDVMDQKPFVHEWGKHTAVTLRLTQPWWHTGRCVVGDSFFGSFRCSYALLSKALYSVMNIKTNSSQFPKKRALAAL